MRSLALEIILGMFNERLILIFKSPSVETYCKLTVSLDALTEMLPEEGFVHLYVFYLMY